MSKFEKTLQRIIEQIEEKDAGVRLVFAVCGREAVSAAYLKNFKRVGLTEFPGTFEQGFEAGKTAVEELIQLALEKTENAQMNARVSGNRQS